MIEVVESRRLPPNSCLYTFFSSLYMYHQFLFLSVIVENGSKPGLPPYSTHDKTNVPQWWLYFCVKLNNQLVQSFTFINRVLFSHVGNGIYHVLQGGAESSTWISKSMFWAAVEVVVVVEVVLEGEKGHFFLSSSSLPMPFLVPLLVRGQSWWWWPRQRRLSSRREPWWNGRCIPRRRRRGIYRVLRPFL